MTGGSRGDFRVDGLPTTYQPQGATRVVRGVHLTVAFVLVVGVRTPAGDDAAFTFDLR